MVSEWDGTAWGGTTVPESFPRGNASIVAKAATGLESIYYPGNVPISVLNRHPLRFMREAQALYWSNPWIGTAEDAVTRRVTGLPWHLEDQNEDTVDDEATNPLLQSVRLLLEKPQAALPEDERQTGYETWMDMIGVTSRHMGLCGIGYWYLDSVDSQGIPNAILYVNPARLFPVVTQQGRLLGYVLDPKDEQGRGGTPLKRNEIVPFYFRPPDFGALPQGLVERAALKAAITTKTDRHTANVLDTGGRLAGILAPKTGYIAEDDRWEQLERDFRNISEDPNAAKRTTLIRGAVDFQRTAGDAQELGLADVARMERDDIFSIWGVPPSQAGVAGSSTGLNSGETRKYDQEVLMTGAVHDRVAVIVSTIQLRLLDRWAPQPQLVIEEPSFDDEMPAYELASKAQQQPLTVNERRAILKLDPLPDYGPDGEPLGLAIILPAILSTFAQGPEDDPNNPFAKAPTPRPIQLGTLPPPPLAQIGAGAPSPAPTVAKAGTASLRKTLDRAIPSMRKTMESVLSAQLASVISKLKTRGEALRKRPSTVEALWDEPAEDARLAKALKPHIAGIASSVVTQTRSLLTAKADFESEVEDYLLGQAGKRIRGINDTTRDAVIAAIRSGLDEGFTIDDIAASLRDLPAFDEARAELVARTESGYAYNTAAVRSYGEYGVEKVYVIDGDGDPICAEADGATWTLERAEAEPLGHPNCVRDFAPVAA